MTKFELNGVTYERNEKGNRFYKTTDKTDAKGNALKVRIGEHVFEQAWDEFMKTEEYQAEQELKARKDLQEKKDREAEDNFNKKRTKKPRRPKDIAFEHDTIKGHITLTAKQVEFIKLLPKCGFWEEGIESTLWCDCIADEIGWNPMTVGAMISTLREKDLVEVRRDGDRKGKPKYMTLTIVGQVIAEKLGLH